MWTRKRIRKGLDGRWALRVGGVEAVSVGVRGLGGVCGNGAMLSVSGLNITGNRLVKLMNGGNTNGAALLHLVLSLVRTSSNFIRDGKRGIGRDRT